MADARAWELRDAVLDPQTYAFGELVQLDPSNLPKHRRRNIFDDILRIHNQHPDHTVATLQIVDDAVAASLASTGRPPSQFENPPVPEMTGPLPGAAARNH